MLLPGISVWLMTVAFFQFAQKVAAEFSVSGGTQCRGKLSAKLHLTNHLSTCFNFPVTKHTLMSPDYSGSKEFQQRTAEIASPVPGGLAKPIRTRSEKRRLLAG
jgi:hypothetical protein